MCFGSRLMAMECLLHQVLICVSYSSEEFGFVLSACCKCSRQLHKKLIGDVRRKGCILTFTRLLKEFGALREEDGSIDEQCMSSRMDDVGRDDRKFFWHWVMEELFLPGIRLSSFPGRIIQRDYIHCSGIIFASNVKAAVYRKLHREFRRSYQGTLV
jgi:hypothetical protein